MSGTPIKKGTIVWEQTNVISRVDYGDEEVQSSLIPQALRLFSDGKLKEIVQREELLAMKVSRSEALNHEEESRRSKEIEALTLSMKDISMDNTEFEVGTIGFLHRGKYSGFPVSFKRLQSKNSRHIENELLILKSLRNPCVLDCYGFIVNANEIFLVFEEILYGSLYDLLMKKELFPDFPLALSIAWMRDIAAAVSFVHAKGIIHRDVCPSNFLVFRHFRLKLFEFGRAKMDESWRKSVFSASAQTTFYQDPDVSATGTFSKASDVYSLGMTCITIWRRESPTSENPLDQLYKNCPNTDLNSIISKCIVPIRERVDAAEVFDDFKRLCDDPRDEISDPGIWALWESLLEKFSSKLYSPKVKPLVELSKEEVDLLSSTILKENIRVNLTGLQLSQIKNETQLAEVKEFREVNIVLKRELLELIGEYLKNGVPLDMIKSK